MATGKAKSPAPFDPNVWLEAQRRNFEAFTDAGQIVADSMRTVSERQAAMMQEAMSELWGEMQSFGSGAAKPSQPQEQFQRMRAAFERVTTQVQEMSSMLLRAQQEAMEVLNRCAAANMDQFGVMTPDLAAMQKAASDAMQAATSQVSAAIEEMRRRMSDLEDETKQAMSSAGGGETARRGRGGAAKSG